LARSRRPGDDRRQKEWPRRLSFAGLHPTTAVSAGAIAFLAARRRLKPKKLAESSRRDETSILEPSRAVADLPRKGRKRGGPRQASGPPFGHIPVSRRPRRRGAHSTRSCADAAPDRSGVAGRRDGENHLIGDGGERHRRLPHRQRPNPLSRLPARASRPPRAPSLHINNFNAYHGPPQAMALHNRFNGVRNQESCQTISAGGAPSKAGATQATPPKGWSQGRNRNTAPINQLSI